jgi:hypothetical protein
MTYTVLGVFTVLRLFVKKRTKSANFRSAGMLLILLISIIDQSLLIANPERVLANYTDIINTILVVMYTRQIREVWMQIVKVVIATLPVFFILTAYNIVFSLVGSILFSSSPSGDMSYSNIFNSLYTTF